MVEVTCQCGTRLRLGDEWAGRRGKCPRCGAALQLPALAVTGSSRSPALPNVPTMTEAGVKGMNVALWSGLFVPAGTPKPIVDKLAREVRDVLLNTDVKEKLAALATAASGMPPEAFARHIDAEIRMWRSVVKEGNLKFGE